MKKGRLRWFLLSLLPILILGECAREMLAPATRSASYEGKISRQKAMEFASVYSGGTIKKIERTDRFTTGYLIQNNGGQRLLVNVSDGEKAPEWKFCSEGDRISLSVKDFPLRKAYEGTAGMDGVPYFLTPLCH